MPIEYWTTHNLDKLFPESEKPAGADNAIELYAARNEFEDAQVAIRIPAGVEITAATCSCTDLVGPDKRRLRQRHVVTHWQWYTYVLNNPRGNTDPSTYLRRAPAFFPDAFLEDETIRIRDAWTQPLWVTVHIPPQTPPRRL